MKYRIIILVLCVLLSGCNSSKDADIQNAKQAILDSINNATLAKAAQQRTIDSMKQVAEHEKMVREEQHRAETTSAPESEKKKGMNNTAKGAIIGGGAGAVTGAVAGAILSKDKGKGAVIGGIIGAATGAGVGAAAGHASDKKKEPVK